MQEISEYGKYSLIESHGILISFQSREVTSRCLGSNLNGKTIILIIKHLHSIAKR